MAENHSAPGLLKNYKIIYKNKIALFCWLKQCKNRESSAQIQDTQVYVLLVDGTNTRCADSKWGNSCFYLILNTEL